MDVKALQSVLAAFAAERGWNPGPKSLAMALAGEAGALVALLKWLTDAQSARFERPEQTVAAADAIADVLLYAFRLADQLDIDVEEAVRRKIAKDVAKYPVPGRAGAPAGKAATARGPSATQGLREELRQAVTRMPAQRASTSATRGGELHSGGRAPTQAPAQPAARPQPAPPAPARPSPAPAGSGAQSSSAPRSAGPMPTPPTPAGPESVPPPDRFATIDSESVIGFAQSLSRRVDGARGDDPLLRELHDELQTLRRNLYSSSAKPAWIGASLETIRGMLEEAMRHAIGEELRAKEHLVQLDRILSP